MRSDLEKRRRECLEKKFSGETKWKSEIARKYGVSRSAIVKDMNRLGSWIDDLNGGVLKNALNAAKEAMVQMKKVQEESWNFYHNANANDNARIGALSLINRSSRQYVELLQSLGELEKELGHLQKDEIPKDERIVVNISEMEEEADKDLEKELKE